MIRADMAIARLRRDLAVGSAIRWVLLGAAVVAVVVGPLVHPALNSPLMLAMIGFVWLMLSYTSIKGQRIAAQLPMIIASGDFDQAEHQIDQALRSFSIFRSAKLRSIQQLAVLRHAQRRYAETAMLCRALLAERLGALRGISRSALLMLADSMLEMGDLRGAYEALGALYRQRLSLNEAMELTVIQTDYLARIGAWGELMKGVGYKVEMVELMPGARSARVQAMLALAAKKVNRPDWEQYLRRRAELLVDAHDLIAWRPMLAELWTVRGGQEGTGA